MRTFNVQHEIMDQMYWLWLRCSESTYRANSNQSMQKTRKINQEHNPTTMHYGFSFCYEIYIN